MNDGERLLRAVCEEPDDDAPRLVYSDWLEENGQEERAELIRVQIAAERLPEYSPERMDLEARAFQLVRRRGKEWATGLSGIVRDEYHRGFTESFLGGPQDWLGGARTAVAVAPLTRLQLFEWVGAVAKFAGSTRLRQIRRLRLSGHGEPGFGSVVRLFTAPPLATLRRLELSGFDGAAVVNALTGPSALPRLEGLNLTFCRLGPAGAGALMNADNLQRLRYLRLGGIELTREVTRGLKGSGFLSGVVSLDVASCSLDADGLLDLLDGMREGNLRRLVVNHNPIGDQGAQRLASAPHLAGLEGLSISGTGITPAGIEAIATSPNLASLRHLELNGLVGAKRNAELIAGASGLVGLTSVSMGALNAGVDGEAGDSGLLRLARLPNIRQLQMDHAGVTDHGLQILARSPNLGPLLTLDLAWNNITDEGIVSLASTSGMSALVRLMLNNIPFGDRGARALSESEYLTRLSFLGLGGLSEHLRHLWPQLGHDMTERIERRFGPRSDRAYYTPDD